MLEPEAVAVEGMGKCDTSVVNRLYKWKEDMKKCSTTLYGRTLVT